jgi:hypothetical protein
VPQAEIQSIVHNESVVLLDTVDRMGMKDSIVQISGSGLEMSGSTSTVFGKTWLFVDGVSVAI